MNRSTQTLAVVAASFFLVVAAAAARAGVINPPAGPIAPTPGLEPRTEVNAANTPGDSDSLFKIIRPGSYYLSGNIFGVPGRHGIEIAASDVTLDLNGYTLIGTASSLDGMTATDETGGGIGGVIVVSGSVESWAGDGVDLRSASAKSCRVERVTANNNAGVGVGVGPGANVLECIAASNAAGGIIVASGSVVADCIAFENFGNGIEAVAASGTDTGSTITNCTTRRNKLDGILAAGPSVITGNHCADNGLNGDGAGVRVTGSGCRIDSNNCVAADRGVVATGTGNVITRNTCSGNGLRNWDIAIGNVILVVVGTTSSGFSGNSGGTAPGSTDPSANFSY